MVMPLDSLRGVVCSLNLHAADGHLDRDDLVAAVERALNSSHCTGLLVGALPGADGGIDLSEENRHLALTLVTERVGGRIPVLAGAWGSSTAQAQRAVRIAEGCGANGVVTGAPLYWPANGATIAAHIAGSMAGTALPILLLNDPRTFGASFPLDALALLAEDGSNVAGLIDCGQSYAWSSAAAFHLNRQIADPVLLAGSILALPQLALGARGVVVPADFEDALAVDALCRAVERHDFNEARKLQRALYRDV